MKVNLWRDDVTMLRPVQAATQRYAVRSRLFLEVEHGGVVGFGEVAPQSTALNGDPSIDDVIDELRITVMPLLVAAAARESGLPSWTRIARFAGPRPASNCAVALVEMALMDREFRSTGADVSSLWPAQFDTPEQATVSLLDDEVSWSVEPGVARVRAKTAPGTLSLVARRRLEALDRPVILDFNCSASSVADVLEQLHTLSRVVDVEAVEQPFAMGNIVDHAELAARMEVAVSLDEGVRSLRDLTQIVRYDAARMVCIKPARVGGLANARTMFVRAGELGLRAYLGGFFESSYARGVHRILARHCVSEPSDIAVVALSEPRRRAELVTVKWGFDMAPNPEIFSGAKPIVSWG